MPLEYRDNWGFRLSRRIICALKGESGSGNNSSRDFGTGSPARTKDAPGSPSMKLFNSGANALSSSQFDDRWLINAQARTSAHGRWSGSSIGIGLGAICLLPFGPIAMFVCAIGGLLLGYLVGVFYDMQKSRQRNSVAEKELKRLTYLVRFAGNQISRRIFTHESDEDSEYCQDLLVDVILEFKPFVEIAHLSPTVHKRLRLLHSFLSRKPVLQCLWVFVNKFLSKWTTSLTVMEFMDTCSNVLNTLVLLERKLQLVDYRHRLDVIVKVEDFLNDPAIKAFYISHACPSGPSKKSLEAVLVRDAKRIVSSNKRHRAGSMQSALSSFADDEFADEFQDPAEEIEETNFLSPISEGRPFFNSFRDFLEFDLEFKHRMPILDSEARFLYEKEAEPLDAPGWDLTVNKPLIKVLRYIETTLSARSGSSPPVLVRAYAKIPNSTMENVYYHISDTAKRTQWDMTFSRFDLIPNNHSPSCEILYCMLNSPFGVTPRDFLQYRKTIVDSNSITILMRSAEHPAKPHVQSCIRAETYISGYVIRQNATGCDLFLMSQTDIKGLIPKWIVNMMAAKAPAQWIDNLVKSCEQFQADQFSGDAYRMREFLQEYMRRKNFSDPTV